MKLISTTLALAALTLSSASAFVVDVSTAVPGAGAGVWNINTACGPIIITSTRADSFNHPILPNGQFTVAAGDTLTITTGFAATAASFTLWDFDQPGVVEEITINGTTLNAVVPDIPNHIADTTSITTTAAIAGTNVWTITSSNAGAIGIAEIDFTKTVPEPSSSLLGALLVSTLLLRRRR